jgi:hypothetical protein
VKALFLVLMLTGCVVFIDSEITPEECRQYGVDVADNANRTGYVVGGEFKTLGGVMKVCGEGAQGCSVGLNGDFPDDTHRYRIYYAEGRCVPTHESCHAIYETWNHTVAFNLRWMLGDMLASCPG